MQPPAAAAAAPTASELRVETIAQHLASDPNIPTAGLDQLPGDTRALLKLEELGKSLNPALGRVMPDEVAKIIARVRELRGETPKKPPQNLQELMSSQSAPVKPQRTRRK